MRGRMAQMRMSPTSRPRKLLVRIVRGVGIRLRDRSRILHKGCPEFLN